MGLVAGVSARIGMAHHSRRGCCGGSRGILAAVAVAATVVAWLVGLPAPAPVWARARVPAAAEVGTAAAMLAATALADLVLVAAGIAVAVVVGFPAGGLVSAAAVVGVVAVGETQGPVARVWCYSGGQRLTRRAYWHCFRVGRS